MGPFPHDAPPATISADNPMGTDGFEFIEYAAPDPVAMGQLFERMGFKAWNLARMAALGLLLLQAGPDVLRFVPALNLTDAELADGLARLRLAIAAYVAQH